nr:hypothetical protein [Hoylesella shahii]
MDCITLCILFLGGESILSFAFDMSLGVIFGTLLSIFIAVPSPKHHQRCRQDSGYR